MTNPPPLEWRRSRGFYNSPFMKSTAAPASHRLPEEKFLPPAVPVHVQCRGFKCLAYRDEQGAWRNFHSREPLLGAVRLLPYPAN